MEDLLIEILLTFGFPVIQQGSLSPDEKYPDAFFTFWNNDSPDDDFYDNKPNAIVWDYDVNFYSTDPVQVYSALKTAKTKLIQAGFICPDNGHTVGSDEPTHIGRGMNVLFKEKLGG